MPHLTLEYTASLAQAAELAGVLGELNHLIADIANIQIGNFKSRAIQREVFVVGAEESDEGFVHLEIAILSGRTPAIKEEIGCGCLAILERRFCPRERGPAIQITVEIREIDREGYFKSA
jgi:5-carboxymethyl-2-hydroxymuconate isomerase